MPSTTQRNSSAQQPMYLIQQKPQDTIDSLPQKPTATLSVLTNDEIRKDKTETQEHKKE